MSYVRWSRNSDLYIYYDTEWGYTILVASKIDGIENSYVFGDDSEACIRKIGNLVAKGCICDEYHQIINEIRDDAPSMTQSE